MEIRGLSFGGEKMHEVGVADDDPTIPHLNDAIRHLRAESPKQAMAALYDAMSVLSKTHNLNEEWQD